MTDADEGRMLAAESGLPLFAESSGVTQALLAGLRGEFDEAETLAAEAERSILPMLLTISSIQLI